MRTIFSLFHWWLWSSLAPIDYYAYLDSRAWKFRRKLVRWWASGRCQVCYTNGEKLDTHHRTYLRLGRERLTDLILLCHTHHEQFHNIRRFD